MTLKLDDESERDPEVLVYINNFKDKEGRINLLNKCYALFNESVFQNKLPKDLPLFWNGKLTSSGGYCKKSVKNKKAFVEIHISVKICDNPGIYKLIFMMSFRIKIFCFKILIQFFKIECHKLYELNLNNHCQENFLSDNIEIILSNFFNKIKIVSFSKKQQRGDAFFKNFKTPLSLFLC